MVILWQSAKYTIVLSFTNHSPFIIKSVTCEKLLFAVELHVQWHTTDT